TIVGRVFSGMHLRNVRQAVPLPPHRASVRGGGPGLERPGNRGGRHDVVASPSVDQSTSPGGAHLKMRPTSTHVSSAVTPLAAAAVAVTGVSVLLGVGVLVFGATRPYRSLLYAHIGTSVAGSAVLIVYPWRATLRR